MKPLDVPTCACVLAARKISILRIPDSIEVEGHWTGNSAAGPAYGFLVVRCKYCGAVLKTQQGFDFARIGRENGQEECDEEERAAVTGR